MDDSDRRNRGDLPSWRPAPQPVSHRTIWPRFESVSEPTRWLLNVALIVLLCIVAMAIATTALRQWWPAAAPTTEAVVVAPSAERAEAHQLFVATEALERQARQKEQEQADRRRAAAIEQREIAEEAVRRTAAVDARRERDWQAWYQKPARCDPALPNIDSVGCANDYIRARRTFDAQFTASLRR